MTLLKVWFIKDSVFYSGFSLYRIPFLFRVQFIQDSVFVQGSVSTGFRFRSGFGLDKFHCSTIKSWANSTICVTVYMRTCLAQPAVHLEIDKTWYDQYQSHWLLCQQYLNLTCDQYNNIYKLKLYYIVTMAYIYQVFLYHN